MNSLLLAIILAMFVQAYILYVVIVYSTPSKTITETSTVKTASGFGALFCLSASIWLLIVRETDYGYFLRGELLRYAGFFGMMGGYACVAYGVFRLKEREEKRIKEGIK